MKKILILSPYPEGVAPSQRLKFEQYYPYLREAGYELTISPFVNKSFWKIIYVKGHFLRKAAYTIGGYLRRIGDLFRLHRYDVVYTHLWVTPFGPPFFEWMVCKLNRKVIYDIDDLIYLSGIKSHMNPVISRIKGNTKPLYLMKHAKHVITCTPYLDNVVRQYNQHTTDISSTIDTQTNWPKKEYAVRGRIILGWTGSPSTSKYLLQLQPVLEKLKGDGYDFKLVVMGDNHFKMDGVEVELIPWNKDHEADVIRSFDIGLYPLPDEEWVYGKSGLKAIMYMSCGVPTIAQAIGTNFRLIDHGKNGFLANTDEEWLDCLKALIDSEQLRTESGTRGAEFVEANYSINANKHTYIKIIDEVVSPAGKQ